MLSSERQDCIKGDEAHLAHHHLPTSYCTCVLICVHKRLAGHRCWPCCAVAGHHFSMGKAWAVYAALQVALLVILGTCKGSIRFSFFLAFQREPRSNCTFELPECGILMVQ
jgi:hypothetical protein